MTVQEPMESTYPGVAPRGLTRRRALGLALAAGAGALVAACGEPEIPKIQPPVLPSTQRTQAAATQRTESAVTPPPTVAVNLGERAPSREGNLPEAGANRPISIPLGVARPGGTEAALRLLFACPERPGPASASTVALTPGCIA